MNDKQLTPEEILRKHFGPDIGNYEFDYTLVVAAMNEHNATLQARVQELEREKETLLGLLEKAVKEGYYLTAGREQRWQSYKQKHGLQSPENTDNG